MDLTDLLQGLSFSIDDVFVVVKLFYLLALLMYLVFSVVVVRQVEMMLAALGGVLQFPLRMVAWIHVMLVLLVFGVAIVL